MSRAVEMNGVIDEEDDNFFKPPEPKKKKLDWDQFCAYKTFKIVRIKDRYLGMLYWGIVSVVVLYVIIVALGIERKHQIQEPGLGTIITRFRGKAFDQDGLAYDEADLRFPEIEPYGAFIMSKSVTVRHQEVKKCVEYDKPCVDELCPGGATCVNGYCQLETAWCPSIGDGNVEKLKHGDEGGRVSVKRISGIESMTLEIYGGISFPGLEDRFFRMEPETQLRSITVADLLKRANPPVEVEDVIDTGALINLSLYWYCDISDSCEPSVTVRRMDSQGFAQKRSKYYVKDGKNVREATHMYGLRVLVDSTGEGREFKFVLFIIQVGSCLALLRTASMAADYLMLNCYSQEKVAMYYKCKIIETQDYSDLQDRINIIQDAEKETTQLLKRSKNLGLGLGGRGGIASSILK